jgi:hypothetical protein
MEVDMWEDVTIAVCLLGFVGALALMLAELPAVVDQTRRGCLEVRGISAAAQ